MVMEMRPNRVVKTTVGAYLLIALSESREQIFGVQGKGIQLHPGIPATQNRDGDREDDELSMRIIR